MHKRYLLDPKHITMPPYRGRILCNKSNTNNGFFELMLLFTQAVKVRGYPLSELTDSDLHYLRSTLPPTVT